MPPASKRALALNEQAASALADCERDVADLAARRDILESGDRRGSTGFYWISSETWLALGDSARDLGRHAQARSAFRSSKKAFDCLTAFSREHSVGHERSAEVETLWNRVRDGLLAPLPDAAK